MSYYVIDDAQLPLLQKGTGTIMRVVGPQSDNNSM